MHFHQASGIRRTAAGFTLVEVLVSSALAVLLLAVLAGAVSRMGQDGRVMSDHIDRGSRVRLVMDLLTTDLQSMIVREDANNWLAIDILDNTSNSGLWADAPGQKPLDESLVLDPRGQKDSNGLEWIEASDYRFGTGGMWLRFFTGAADRALLADGQPVPGDVNAVSYQVIRRPMPGVSPTNNAAASYQLFRSLVRSDRTFAAGYKIEAYTGAAEAGGPGEMKAPDEDSLVCDNIIDLGVIVHEVNAEGKTVQAFPMRHASLPPLRQPMRYRIPQDGIPAGFEVLVRVLSASGARELRTLETASMPPAEWWALARRHSRVYSRWFSVPRAF